MFLITPHDRHNVEDWDQELVDKVTDWLIRRDLDRKHPTTYSIDDEDYLVLLLQYPFIKVYAYIRRDVDDTSS